MTPTNQTICYFWKSN